MITNFVRGFCMALADSVPGVSGGTVAFLLGFYDRFITSIDDALHGTRPARLSALRFLAKLGIGWVVGFALAAFALSSLFEHHVYAVSSLFMGFIACSIPFLVREHKTELRSTSSAWVFALVGFALVALVTFASPVINSTVNLANDALSPSTVLYVFIAAMVAISAMVLPGISGSTLLLVFGLYAPIMTAIRATLSFDMNYVAVLGIFAAGAFCGVLLFTRVMKHCLEHYRAQIMFFVIGMMAGSLLAIARGPLTLDIPLPAMDLTTFDLGFAFVGAALVWALNLIRQHIERRDTRATTAPSKDNLAQQSAKTTGSLVSILYTARYVKNAWLNPARTIKPRLRSSHLLSSRIARTRLAQNRLASRLPSHYAEDTE